MCDKLVCPFECKQPIKHREPQTDAKCKAWCFSTSKIKKSQAYVTIYNMPKQWRAYAFSSMFVLDVATKSPKDHKLLRATYILCSKKICN